MFYIKKETLVTIVVFSLLIIVIFLSIDIIRKDYVKNKKLLDGKILVSQLMNASITYYRNNGKYLVNDKVSFNDEYPFDARLNPYFSVFSTYPVDENKQGISVFGTIDKTKYEIKVVFDKNDEPTSLENMKIQIIKK